MKNRRFWTQLEVSRRFQLAIYTVWHVEFESAVRNGQIRQPDEKIEVQNVQMFFLINPKNPDNFGREIVIVLFYLLAKRSRVVD